VRRPASPDSPRLHRVTTPEGVSLPFLVARAGDRANAFAIDLAVIVAGTIATTLLGLVIAGSGAPGLGFSLALLASFLLRNAYFIFCEIRWSGRTVGKRRLGLRVISRDGGPLTAEAVLARNLTRDLEFFLPVTALLAPRMAMPEGPGWAVLAALAWLFVFAFLPLFGRDRLRCGDLVAGTMVVEEPAAALLPDLAMRPELGPAPAGEKPAAMVASAAPAPVEPALFTREQLDLYGVRELQVLEDILRRWYGGSLASEILADVRRRIEKKIGWNAAGRRLSDLDFLEAFYRAQRARLEQKKLFGQRLERKRDA
jgi:uncharacterized RDD family membrane protein YckC